MPDTRGVFGLFDVVDNSLAGDYVPLTDIWVSPSPLQSVASNTGYFGGGFAPGAYSTVDKLNYSTDITAVVPGAFLSVARRALAATGNSTAGYFGGGLFPGVPGTYSTMDKLTYSTDTTAAVPGAALNVARFGFGATGSTTAGYFGGGFEGSPRSTMDKVTYVYDTCSLIPGANLTVARYSLAATGSSTAGYFGGGLSPSNVSTMDKLTYSSDTTALAPTSANLSTVRSSLAATGNSTAGYFGGGNSPGVSSTMDKLTFATENTSAVATAALSIPRNTLAALSSRANALPGVVSTLPSSASSKFIDGTLSPQTGYFAGGASSATVDKLNYSTDLTAAIPSAFFAVARAQQGATGNTTAGYFGGGFDYSISNFVSSVQIITYAADTNAVAPTTAFFSSINYGLSATGNSTAGYFGGGSPGTRMSKLSYNSNTMSDLPGAALSISRSKLAATGNSTAGYFGGGFNNISRMDKVTYSTDTTAAVPGASLSAARAALAATGNSTVGYFGGGYYFTGSAFNYHSTMDKVTYSTDTTAAVPGAALSAVRYGLAATGSSTAGAYSREGHQLFYR